MNQKTKTILRPLYMWGFVEALIFWYAIEKVLFSSVGISPDQIIILGLIAQSGQVLFEVPSSIIADRWSRRKTLMTSSVFMLLAVMVVLRSQTFIAIAIMQVLWACYYSFQSGTTNAYIYDLLKEQGEQLQYRKAVSRYATFQLLGLLVSALASSIIAEVSGLLTTYWVTLLPTAAAIFLLWRMHDPAIERTEQSMGTALFHVRSAASNVLKKRWLILVFIALALLTAGQFIWYEYYQLYALERQVPAALFGLMLALIHIGNLFGAELAHRIKSPHRAMMVAIILLCTTALTLAFVSASLAIILFLVISFVGSRIGTIVMDENLQHETSSELRATTLSLAGLASRVLFGLGAVTVIILSVTPRNIALTTLLLFTCAAIYLPARKHLIRPA